MEITHLYMPYSTSPVQTSSAHVVGIHGMRGLMRLAGDPGYTTFLPTIAGCAKDHETKRLASAHADYTPSVPNYMRLSLIDNKITEHYLRYSFVFPMHIDPTLQMFTQALFSAVILRPMLEESIYKRDVRERIHMRMVKALLVEHNRADYLEYGAKEIIESNSLAWTVWYDIYTVMRNRPDFELVGIQFDAHAMRVDYESLNNPSCDNDIRNIGIAYRETKHLPPARQNTSAYEFHANTFDSMPKTSHR